MRTVGRRHTSKAKATFTCDICGVLWPSTKLRKRRDGFWACPDDYPGRDSVTLAELNAAHANEPRWTKAHPEAGSWDLENGAGAVTQLTDGSHLP